MLHPYYSTNLPITTNSIHLSYIYPIPYYIHAMPINIDTLSNKQMINIQPQKYYYKLPSKTPKANLLIISRLIVKPSSKAIKIFPHSTLNHNFIYLVNSSINDDQETFSLHIHSKLTYLFLNLAIKCFELQNFSNMAIDNYDTMKILWMKATKILFSNFQPL